ncbi:MAG: translation initiation factor IF-3 [Bdellovibrionales bacterium]|nr:translation initiation factor IF-3 [Bdellovibrionales bacterium]
MKGRWVIRRSKKRFKGIVKKEEKFKVNDNIEALEVRVIGSDGKMLGVMSVSRGTELAHQEGLDLVEIAPKAQPPTCKIMDYGKWKFDAKKKEKSARKKQTKIVIKEIQVRPRTDTFDLEVKIRKAREFLISGYKVKLHLRFSGRELAHTNLGLDVIDRVAEKLKDLSMEDVERSKMERRSVYALFSPDPIKLKEYLKKNPPKPKAKEPEEQSSPKESDKT